MASSVIVRCIFVTTYEQFRMKELTISSRSYFVDNTRLEVDKHRPGYVFSKIRFTEECTKRIIFGLVVVKHRAIRFESVFQAIQLPTRIANLASGLANMN